MSEVTLTKVQIDLMCESAIGLDSNKTERLWTRLKAEALRDLALSALSQEAVRDEVLEEALNHAEVIGNVVSALLDLNVTYDGSRAIFTFETTDNAMGHIWSARDIVAKRLDAIRALKREPNAAAWDRSMERASGERTSAGTSPSPAPAAPNVASMVKRLRGCVNDRHDPAVTTCEDIEPLALEAATLLAKLGQQDLHVVMDAVRKWGFVMTNAEILAQLKHLEPGASDD